MEIKKINIIGFGNVGQNLFFHLNQRIEIVNVYNRSKTKMITELLNDKLVIDANKNNLYFKKVVKPTIEEMKLHKNYLKTNLKKNYFS